MKDLEEPDTPVAKAKSTKSKGRRRSDDDEMETEISSENESESEPKKRSVPKRGARRAGGHKKQTSRQGSPHKSPARRHTASRRHVAELSDEEESSDSEDEGEEDEEKPLKVQWILASRTETISKWREICQKMNTSEIHYGSRWFQDEAEAEDDQQDGEGTSPKKKSEDVFEERFLVKWTDLSFLHCSWETQDDLVDQVENAKTYLATFFRKSQNGLLYSADERCDGDYFDPAWVQIERVLEVEPPANGKRIKYKAEDEDKYDSTSFGMIFDKADEAFDRGTGRQFLVKWAHLPYTECIYEFERDLVLNDVEYKPQVKAFLTRSKKKSKAAMQYVIKKGDEEFRRLYKIFGDQSKTDQKTREKQIEQYKTNLQERVYKSGGQLRDYQAEGVAWMISNYVNQRSSILCDEMGLGKVSLLLGAMWIATNHSPILTELDEYSLTRLCKLQPPWTF